MSGTAGQLQRILGPLHVQRPVDLAVLPKLRPQLDKAGPVWKRTASVDNWNRYIPWISCGDLGIIQATAKFSLTSDYGTYSQLL